MEKGSNTYKVVISPQAAEMLVSHSRFLAMVSEKAAVNLIRDFKKAKTLELFPERSPILSDYHLTPGKYRKLIIDKFYLAVYQIKDNTVYIDAVLDCRQDYGWLL